MTYNDVIQYPGADHVESVLEDGGQRSIGLARFGVTRGMVVYQNHGCGIVLQGDLDYLSRVYAGTIQRASEQLSKADYPVFSIEQ